MEHENVKDALKAAIEIAEAKFGEALSHLLICPLEMPTCLSTSAIIADLLGLSELYLDK
ncbi:hypothetical protein [Enterococcus faecium]|uniref:hypothetical protein n=1 Tax=Enterococcus faecium TaxID=1352 RepID=UPI0022027F9B|nr:hypothetical protein [Enterococcus faecium]BDP97114.1 hypothetical protein EfmGK961_09300 [Enterococcus faecium]